MGLALAVASVAASATPAFADDDYTVQRGDTVSHIALRTQTTVAQIVAANGLDGRASIHAGQHLIIPTSGGGAPTGQPAVAPPAPSPQHTVASGDTVSALALRYGTTARAIVEANGLDARAFIRVGQVLVIPATGATSAATPPAAAPAAPASASQIHTVVAGDTISALATRFATTTAALVAANGLGPDALIRVGQQLTVPGAGPAAPQVGSTFAGRTYPAETVAAANQNKATLVATPTPTTAQMKNLIRETALAMGVDPALALAVAYQESGFHHTAVSPANAIGAMQVIPSTGRWASELVGRDLNLLVPEDNVVAGVAVLRQLVATAPDLPTAIAGYYQGLAGVTRHGMYPDTRRYVASVQTLMSRFA